MTLEDETVVRHDGGRSFAVLPASEILLRGRHNVANVLSAVAVASQLGVGDDQAAAAVRSFWGVQHRLERVATVRGVEYVNDSIATTPERTLAGMRSFEQQLVLLLGGREKRLPLGELAGEVAARCRAVVTFGEAAASFAAAFAAAPISEHALLEQVASVEQAVAAAARLARDGDVVLFSPAGTSFDAYPNFERRGEAFRAAVTTLAEEA